MNIKEKLNRITEFIEINRRSGTTTLLAKIKEQFNDAFVIVHNEEGKKPFRNNGKTNNVLNINRLDYKGLKSRPILFETKVIQDICNESISEINKLHEHNKELNKDLQDKEYELRESNKFIEKLYNCDYKVGVCFHIKLNWFEKLLNYIGIINIREFYFNEVYVSFPTNSNGENDITVDEENPKAQVNKVNVKKILK